MYELSRAAPLLSRPRALVWVGVQNVRIVLRSGHICAMWDPQWAFPRPKIFSILQVVDHWRGAVSMIGSNGFDYIV